MFINSLHLTNFTGFTWDKKIWYELNDPLNYLFFKKKYNKGKNNLSYKIWLKLKYFSDLLKINKVLQLISISKLLKKKL